MPQYSDKQVRGRVHSGKDKNRAATADQLASAATQPPHDDDAAALAQLQQLSSDDSSGAWATNDARNYGRMKLAGITGQPAEYSEARDGGGFAGSLGGIMRKLAPFVGMIPGIGIPAAAAIAFGGNSIGSELQGDGLNLGNSLKDAVLAGGSRFLMNNIGGGTTQVGNATQSGAGAATSAPGSSVLSKIGNTAAGAFKTPTGQLDAGRIIGAGAGAAGILENRAQRHSQEAMANSQLDLRRQQLGMAENAYSAQAPYRSAALQRLGSMSRGSSIYGGRI